MGCRPVDLAEEVSFLWEAIYVSLFTWLMSCETNHYLSEWQNLKKDLFIDVSTSLPVLNYKPLIIIAVNNGKWPGPGSTWNWVRLLHPGAWSAVPPAQCVTQQSSAWIIFSGHQLHLHWCLPWIHCTWHWCQSNSSLRSAWPQTTAPADPRKCLVQIRSLKVSEIFMFAISVKMPKMLWCHKAWLCSLFWSLTRKMSVVGICDVTVLVCIFWETKKKAS